MGLTDGKDSVEESEPADSISASDVVGRQSAGCRLTAGGDEQGSVWARGPGREGDGGGGGGDWLNLAEQRES
jgi:hypothetical protein